MSLDTHVQVNLTINNSGIALAGFGLIGHLSYRQLFPERIRLYSRASEAVADGYPEDGPEVIALTKIFSQSPHPRTAAILRGENVPTQRYAIGVTAVRNLHPYRLQVDGEGVTSTEVEYTSDGAATAAEISDGLLTALHNVVGRNYSATFGASAATAGTFTADNATETFTKNAHLMQTGDGPFQASNSGGALPTGLPGATNVYAIRTGVNTFQLATSRANAFAGTAIAITTDGTGVHTLTPNSASSPTAGLIVTGDAPGEWFSIEVLDTSGLSIKQTHADPGIAADLSAIENADSSWYYLHTAFNSDDMINAAATWIEARTKAYYPETNNSEAENTAPGNGDVLDDLEGAGGRRVVPIYKRSPKQMHGAGWMSLLGAYNPGKWDAAYKTIVGSTADSFTTTQMNNLDLRRASYYKREAGRDITWEGKVPSTVYGFIDVTTGLDAFLDALKKRVFGVFVAMLKVGYVDEDIAIVTAAAEGVVDLFKSDAYDLIAPGTKGDPNDPEPTVKFPRVAEIDPGSRALKKLPNGDVTFRLQGSVHSVDFNVTVSF